MSQDTGPSGDRRRSALVTGGCVALAVTGVLVAAGCLLALRLEATGLGRPRDTGMRPGYTALLVVGAAAGALAPAAACALVGGAPRRVAVAVAAGGLALVVAVSVLGVTVL